METVEFLKTRDNENKESLFLEGLEMAKEEISKYFWYNLNIRRAQHLVSFCMDYLHYQKGSGTAHAVRHDKNCAYYRYYKN
jgi:hypothetical protein